MFTHKNNPRRGVTLLVVLALMVMFAMLVTAFMVIVTQSRRAVEFTAQRRIAPPEIKQGLGSGIVGTTHLELAIQRLLTGTGTLDNVIAPYSILENLYGHSKAPLEIKNRVPNESDGYEILPPQDGLIIVQFPFGMFETLNLPSNLIGSVVTVKYTGTDTSHPLHNKSTLVFDVQTTNSASTINNHVRLVPFNVPDLNVDIDAQGLLLKQDCTLVFNTPPHSGTGAGYDSAAADKAWLTTTDNDVDGGKPYALRPNILAPNTRQLPNNIWQPYKDYLQNADVRMNPDYTAPDYMTMFLAWNDIQDNQLAKIIPSFHRPQLVKYWSNVRQSTTNAFTELRKYVLRPLPADHPDFTGSNPAAKWYTHQTTENDKLEALERFLTEGPWDVDNDGDGTMDGIWLDAGLPPEYDAQTLSWYKPLVSYYVLDMDGRINVNTIGNLAQTEPAYELTEQDRTSGSLDVKGTGMGPADLSSNLSGGAMNKRAFFEDRYDADTDKVPGGTVSDYRSQSGINLETYANGGLSADWFGFSPILFDTGVGGIFPSPGLGNRNVVKPKDTTAAIPYLMNPYTDSFGDKPFTADDLEMLLRSVIDLDYSTLSPRLRDLFGTLFDQTKPAFVQRDLRYKVTTRSSDIPVSISYVSRETGGYSALYEHIKLLCPRDTPDNTDKAANELWMLLPEEIRRGGKVNLNRLTQRNDWMIGNTNNTDLLKAKVRFAQEIYYLLRVLLPNDIPASDDVKQQQRLERLAQWSVNLVDFIDPDDVITPFIYDKTIDTASAEHIVWTQADNSALIESLLAGTLDTGDLTNHNLIWGFEKPEAVITETLALHDRNVQHYLPDTTDPPGFEGKLVQAERPQGSLFVELRRQGNPRQDPDAYQSSSLVENGNLVLTKQTPNKDYVWRLAIGQPTKAAIEKFTWNEDAFPEGNAFRQLLTPDAGIVKYPQFYQWFYDPATIATDGAGQYHPDLGVPDRFIWFGSYSKGNADPDMFGASQNRLRSYYQTNETKTNLTANETVVVAPMAQTIISQPTVTNTTVPIVTIDVPGAIIVNQSVTPVGGGTITVGANISEPLPAWQSDSTFNDGYFSYGMPNPAKTGPEEFDQGILKQRGTIPAYKTICLQRLADPNRAHHPICNPYLTVDWSMIDLQVINSIEQPDGGSLEGLLPSESAGNKVDADMRYSSRQWYQKTPSGKFVNFWDKTLTTDVLADNKAGLEKSEYDNTTYKGLLTAAPKHSLGMENYPRPGSPLPLLHFPWHDAPFMNSGELMLVPATAPGRFGVEFHDNGTTDSFFGSYDLLGNISNIGENEHPRFSYYYKPDAGNSFTASPYLNWGSEDSAYMQRLFDFVHVPSKFVGTVQGWTTSPVPKPIYSMREPGKLNLNTLTEEGWQTLKNGRTNFPSYTEYRQSRQWSGIPGDLNNYPSEFKPFRAPSGTHFVPPLAGTNPERLYDTSTSATLMGLETEENSVKQSALIDEDAANPYTALENVMRLSDVTTTRSNVFAVWVTVGYFDAAKVENLEALQSRYPDKMNHITNAAQFSAIYPDGYVWGAEKGLDNGTAKRHRAFYLIDRSTPVGFRRGEELNSKDVIIKKTVLD